MNSRGFTLIELIVVMGILAVLASIAIPMYSNYKTNAYRAEARAAMVAGAQNMERYYTRNNTYVGASVGTAATDQVQPTTQGGKYTLAIQASDATTFTLRATPSFTDGKCGYLQINQAGAKTSEIAGKCW